MLIFGPVSSRRFGLSLGIDLSPNEKCCNFDCLYCELEKAKVIDFIINPPKVEDVILELKQHLNPKLDVITITANGEPTLYPNLKELILEVNKLKGSSKTLILTNGSTIFNSNIQEALLEFDIVKVSLDSAHEQSFKKIDRPIATIKLEDIINGLIQFRKLYKKELIIEVLFVKNVNDSIDDILALRDVLKAINPNRVDIGTIDRPPAYKVSKISDMALLEIRKLLEDLPINLAIRNIPKELKKFISKEELFNTIANRPLTKSDIEMLYNGVDKFLDELISEKRVIIKNVANISFFAKNS